MPAFQSYVLSCLTTFNRNMKKDSGQFLHVVIDLHANQLFKIHLQNKNNESKTYDVIKPKHMRKMSFLFLNTKMVIQDLSFINTCLLWC